LCHINQKIHCFFRAKTEIASRICIACEHVRAAEKGAESIDYPDDLGATPIDLHIDGR